MYDGVHHRLALETGYLTQLVLVHVTLLDVAPVYSPAIGSGARLAHEYRDGVEPRRVVARLRHTALSVAVIALESTRRRPSTATAAHLTRISGAAAHCRLKIKTPHRRTGSN